MDPRLLAAPAAFGLAGASGLNASLPLLVISLLARAGLVHLAPPFDALQSNVAFYGLICVAVVEFVADKVPALDSVGHVLMAPLAAASGAIVFASQIGTIQHVDLGLTVVLSIFASQTGTIQHVDPGLTVVLSLLLGGGTAAAVHVSRAAVRPVANVALLGPALSLVEDVMACLLATAALLAPVLVPVVAAAIVLAFWALRRRRARGRKALARQWWEQARAGYWRPWHRIR